ncbi:MAG: 50S ribosomal protein L1 [Pseudomonadales bacterium]|nr:50S ribosomal protein L1 [Pseudomonadales bacterium]
MGSKKNVDMSASETVVKVVEDISTTAEDKVEAKMETKKVSKRIRSKKYVSNRARVDKTKKYSALEAVKLIKTLSYSKFDGSITIDGVINEVGKVGTFSLPNSTGKSIKVSIVDDALIEKIAAGEIDFDALVTTPAFMPKLAKYARVLGPKGLMPNPKNGTVTSKPNEKKAELEKGSFDLKTEKKQPVIHVTVGKTSFDDKKIVENIEYLFSKLKGKIHRASISATMSPSVKLEIEK